MKTEYGQAHENNWREIITIYNLKMVTYPKQKKFFEYRINRITELAKSEGVNLA